MTPVDSVELVRGDVTASFDSEVRETGIVAWDIETSGLDWALDQIGTCQLRTPSGSTQIVQMDGSIPERLGSLLEAERVTKVFHHAPFDLRFLRYHWKVAPRNIACTKILAKIVTPGLTTKEYSLKPLLERHLGVRIDKGQQVSDWLASSLSDEQLKYAATDVEYLLPLLELLLSEARAVGAADLVEATFQYIPVRVETDIRGCGDVFAY